MKSIIHFLLVGILLFQTGCLSEDSRSMKPSKSEQRFKKYIESSSKTVADLGGDGAIRLMLDFYREIRASHCSINDDGDMLLYQWGTYDWGEGETFNFNITRQFILEGSEGDDGMSQLSFTVHFSPSENLRKIESGNRWCKLPSEIDNYKKFIINSKAYLATKDLQPLGVELYWDEI